MAILPRVVGVYHTTKHPSYPDVMAFVDQTVQPGQRVAIESPWDCERIEREGPTSKNSNYAFLHALYVQLRVKHAQIFPVEDAELYRISGHFKQWYMYEEPGVLNADERWHELSIKRSIRHLQLSYEKRCSLLFTGTAHACDLGIMGYEDVEFIPPHEWTLLSYHQFIAPHMQRFGVDLSTGEWKHTLYPCVSDMRLENDPTTYST
jgi:hypothetical protein